MRKRTLNIKVTPSGKVKVAILVAMLLGIVYFFLGAIMSAVWATTYTETIEFTVSGKERGSGDYEIYTDKGVFLNQDSMLFLKFNSADIQAELKEGSKYVCSAQGFRLNWYNKRYIKNLLSCEPNVTN